MIGDWYGHLPAGLTAAPIRHHFDIALGKMMNVSAGFDADLVPRPYLAAGSIQPEALVLDETKQMGFTPAELQRYSLVAGDVLVVEGGAGYGRSHLLLDDLPGWGFQNHVARLRSSSGDVDRSFLLYCLKACLASGYVEANNRTATLPSLSHDVLGDIRIPLQPLDEQRRIADFLDGETAQIDRLITKQTALIDTLRERRTAVVDEVVTAGLHPTVPTVDSGTSWIGRIPAHWRVLPLWSMFERIKDVGHPSEQMLSVFREFGVIPKDSRDNINRTAENRNIYQLVHPGWLVTNRMKAWQGSVGVSRHRGIVSGHYICFAPSHEEDHAYLNLLFRSARYAAGYGLISRGVRIGQAEISNDDYRLLPVVVPPIAEQRAIVEFIDKQTAKIDELVAKAEQFVEFAKERRSALITAAVTGQIDLRDVA